MLENTKENILKNIPQELQERPRWAFAISKSNINGYKVAAKASTDGSIDAVNWSTGPYKTLPDLMLHYHELTEEEKNKIGYVTYLISDDDDYACIDLDPKENEKHLEIALALVKDCDDTYVERSQSGTGFHIWTKDIKTKESATQIFNFIDVFSGGTTGRHLVTTGDLVSSSRELSCHENIVENLLSQKRKNKTEKKSNAEKPLLRNRGNFTIEEIAEVLDFIDNETSDDYERWRNIIFGVAYELRQHEDGFKLLYDWSERGAGATENWQEILESTYYDSDNTKNNSITFGTVIHEARESYGKSKFELDEEIEAVKNDTRHVAKYRKEKVLELKNIRRVLFELGRRPKNTSGSDIGNLLNSFPCINKNHLPHVTMAVKGPATRQEATVQNVQYLLDNAAIKVRYNILSRKVEWYTEDTDEEIQEIVKRIQPVMMDAFYSYAMEINMSSRHAVETSLGSIASSNKFHPLKELLDSSDKWDGVDRIQTVQDAVPVAERYKNIWPVYLRKTLYQFMDRVLSYDNPNQHRGILVLCGKQGAGKSTFFQELVNIPGTKDLYKQLESPRDLNGKDAQAQFGRCLVCEIAEIDALIGKQTSADMKMIFTKKVDEYRPPYAREPRTFPRVNSFVGTTNVDEFILDQTGTTRYWVVKCGDNSFDISAMENLDRIQLWKQIEFEYKILAQHQDENSNKKFWHLTEEEDLVRENLNEDAVDLVPWCSAFAQKFGELNWTPETIEKYPQENKHPYTISELIKIMLNNGNEPQGMRMSYMPDVRNFVTKLTGVKQKSNKTQQGSIIQKSYLLPEFSEVDGWPDLNEKKDWNELNGNNPKKENDFLSKLLADKYKK